MISYSSLRTTVASKKSAYNSIKKLLTVIPPSTLILFTRMPESLAIESTTSQVRKHGASNKLRTKWAFVVFEPNPIQVPLAESSQ